MLRGMAAAPRRALPVIVVAQDGEVSGWKLTADQARRLVGNEPEDHESRIETPGPRPAVLLRCKNAVWSASARNFERYFGEPL
jgi:hypothetical protein